MKSDGTPSEFFGIKTQPTLDATEPRSRAERRAALRRNRKPNTTHQKGTR